MNRRIKMSKCDCVGDAGVFLQYGRPGKNIDRPVPVLRCKADG